MAERFGTAAALCELRAGMAGEFERVAPLAVAQCNSIAEVKAVVAASHEHRIPVIPHGAGSSTA